MIIRRAGIEDLSEIQRLNNELFELEFNNYDSSLIRNWPLSEEGKKYFSKEITEGIVLVACIEERIIGYLAGSINTQLSYNNNIQAELDNMYIIEEYRKRGIGQRLVDEFKTICDKNKVDEIKVVSSFKNLSAIEFYKANGFEEAELVLKLKRGM